MFNAAFEALDIWDGDENSFELLLDNLYYLLVVCEIIMCFLQYITWLWIGSAASTWSIRSFLSSSKSPQQHPALSEGSRLLSYHVTF